MEYILVVSTRKMARIAGCEFALLVFIFSLECTTATPSSPPPDTGVGPLRLRGSPAATTSTTRLMFRTLSCVRRSRATFARNEQTRPGGGIARYAVTEVSQLVLSLPSERERERERELYIYTGIFDALPNLRILDVSGNPGLQCLPMRQDLFQLRGVSFLYEGPEVRCIADTYAQMCMSVCIMYMFAHMCM